MQTPDRFYRAADPRYTIYDSMLDSIRFTVERTLTWCRGNLCGTSSFVDPDGAPALWHDFGPLEGPGWACNALGGAVEIAALGRFARRPRLVAIARSIAKHCVDDPFFDRDTGLLRGYRHTGEDTFYWNYMHSPDHDRWLCPGSVAKVHLQLLEAVELGLFAADDAALAQRLALRFAEWTRTRLARTPDGWIPRRCTPDGAAYPHNAWGGDDSQFANSGDGIFVPWLFGDITRRGLADLSEPCRELIAAFLEPGGRFGSINHDTYDDHENVAYSCAFRALARCGAWLDHARWIDAAFDLCLAPLARFQMRDDRNGCATAGLLYMEDSWDTSYLWEDAEAAWAYLEAFMLRGEQEHLLNGLTILRAAALHHHGPFGFLTEGVDWNNHNGVWREFPDGTRAPIHVGGVEFGDVNYTEPFLNNQHIASPTLFYLEQLARRQTRDAGAETEYHDHESNLLARVIRVG